MGKKIAKELKVLDTTPHRGPIILAQSRKALMLAMSPHAIASAQMATAVVKSLRHHRRA
jgi:hypothetical protein